MISDLQAVRENLFPASRAAIEDLQAFPWHRDRTNRIQAYKAHSSQAIVIDVLPELCRHPATFRAMSLMALEGTRNCQRGAQAGSSRSAQM